MQIRTYVIDAFTDEPFKGNPAGVCLLDGPLSVVNMQSIANELNLSETAFLMQWGGDSEYSIRYFTPTVEVPFCGHATLASSKLLLHRFGKSEVSFVTHHDLHLWAKDEGDCIMMRFPLYDTIPYEAAEGLYAAFNIKNPLDTRYEEGLQMLVVEVADKQSLLDIQPDFAKAIQCTDEIKELVVTAKSNDGDYDFYSRCFCPWIGIDEDPVTGAAHTVLARYWGDQLGKTEMSAYQVSQRGGYMRLRIVGEGELEVRSNACIVLEGVMNV